MSDQEKWDVGYEEALQKLKEWSEPKWGDQDEWTWDDLSDYED